MIYALDLFSFEPVGFFDGCRGVCQCTGQPSLDLLGICCAHSIHRFGDGKSLAEFKIKTNSEETWMKAANRGFKNPKAASRTPTPSTPKVPTKLAMMIR